MFSWCTTMGLAGWLVMVALWGTFVTLAVWAISRLIPAPPKERADAVPTSHEKVRTS